MHIAASSTRTLDSVQLARVDELLDELLDLPGTARAATLARKRDEDPAVLREVESLLLATDASHAFLSQPALPAQIDSTADPAVGRRIGAWRVTRLIGRGGMGEVYAAARADGSFDQTVAIKLLQQDAVAQLELFKAERQILARLEHRGIARLYDGGVSEDGRPYMVMEYVEGRSITDYCTLKRCSLTERLGLFVQVCDAVAYAHRNLVVHRDLKASNILVAADGSVKLLDFGIAKLMNDELTRVTQAAAPMSLLCAAPEQLTGGVITTTTDVYALGLLLFELLTGTHPFKNFDTPVAQALRAVLQRPAPPASRAAQQKGPLAPVPPRVLRGDLDAIIARALRLEPAYRYATVEGMRLDVLRHLRGDPVAAREGARMYVIGRTLLRYRWVAAGVTAVVVSLAAGLGVAAWQANRAALERDAARRDAAREEAVRYSLTSLFRSAIGERGSEPATAKGMIDASAHRVIEQYRDRPQLLGPLVLTLADLYASLEDVNGASALLEDFIAAAHDKTDAATLADASSKLANLELLRGHNDQAWALLQKSDELWAKLPPSDHLEERLQGLLVRARLQRTRGDLDGSIQSLRAGIVERTALSGHDHRETAVLYSSLAIALGVANRFAEALEANREASAIYRNIKMGDSIDAQIVAANTGNVELRLGHLHEAEVLLQTAVERERAVAGDSAAVAAAMSYYGRVLVITNRIAPALSVLRDAVTMGARYAGPDSPVVVQAQLFLGDAMLAGGDPKGAAKVLNTTHDAVLKHLGPANLLTLRCEVSLAQVAVANADYARAELMLTEAAAGLRKLGSMSEPHLALSLETLGEVELAQNRIPQAINALREAVALREHNPEDLWEIALARERLGEAMQHSSNGSGLPLLKRAALDLETQLGATHPQTLRAREAMARKAP